MSEWTTVTKKKSASSQKRNSNGRRRQRPVPVKQQSDRAVSPTPSVSLPQLQDLLEKSVDQLRMSEFWNALKETLLTDDKLFSISEIVCYGIGNFGASSNHSAPMWQLACALAIREDLCSKEAIPEILYFDPCMTEQESAFLKQRNVSVISENERGKRHVKRSIDDDDKDNQHRTQTLFFMPHCPLKLYTNLFHTNWHQLNRIVVFGNSMTAYADRLNVTPPIRFLQALQPHWQELVLPISPTDLDRMPAYFENAFNDSYITSFVKPTASDKGWPDIPDIDLEADDGYDAEVF